MKKIILFFLITNLKVSFAEDFPKIFVFHINGVNTTLDQARRNAEKLTEVAKVQSNFLANKGEFDILYNKKDPKEICSVCIQLLEVLKQKKGEDYTLDDFTVAWMNTCPNRSYPVGSFEYEQLKKNIKSKYFNDPEFMGQNLPDLIKDFHDKTKLSEQFKYVKSYIEQYYDSLMDNASNPLILTPNDPNETLSTIVVGEKIIDGNKPLILLIPHSQGNLYANKLYEFLTQSENYPSLQIQSVGIATPTSHIKMLNSTYITSINDKVINMLRVLANPEYEILPGNIAIPTPKTSLGHSLIDIYLTDSQSKSQIHNAITKSLTALFGIGFSFLSGSHEPYLINYAVQASKLNQPYDVGRPKFLDPAGNDLLCVNADECNKLGFPYYCIYESETQPNACFVNMLNLPSGTYLGLKAKDPGWTFAASTSKPSAAFYCYNSPKFIKNESGDYISYTVNIISQAGCHIVDSLAPNFSYRQVLPEMFIDNYYKSFWLEY